MNENNYQYLLDEKRWIKSNKFPESVSLIYNIFEINNTCYIVGTKGISTINNEFYKYSSNKEYYWCATCRVGNNILVVCYNILDDEVGSSLFNPISNQYIDVNIKTKRKHFAVICYLNKVWIIGGRERDDGQWKTLNTVEVYDPVTKNQIPVPVKMNEARLDHSAIVYKNKLFVFGGFGKDGRLNSVESFSLGTNEFVMMAPMKFARTDFACCRVGNLVYVIGGLVPDDGPDKCRITKSVEIYNLDSNTWTDGINFPVAESGLYACAVNNLI